jgi:hypothetical protein
MSTLGTDPFLAGSKPTKAAGSGTPRTDFGIAGVIGAELSMPLHTLRRIIQALGESDRLSAGEVRELEQALEQANLIVRQSQQLARLSEGRLRQSHERVSLDQMVQSALQERQDAFQERGILLAQAIKPVEIVVDPGLLSNLVETAIDWAMDNSVHVAVNLAISAWPEHGLLSIAATRRADPPEPGRNGTASASLRWHLLSQIARTMGVILSATNQGIDTTLRLEFARTVKHLEGLTSMEIESSSSDSALHTGTKALAGLRILLISTDAAVRGEVEKACRALGLRADTVATSAKAVRYTERDQPHMIIVDERLRDNEFDALMQDIRRLDPRFGFLEVTDDVDTFEVASWAGDSMTRVSRNALRAQLPAVLTLELAKAF